MAARTYSKSFEETWAFESEMRGKYAGCRIAYGEPRIAKSGKQL